MKTEKMLEDKSERSDFVSVALRCQYWHETIETELLSLKKIDEKNTKGVNRSDKTKTRCARTPLSSLVLVGKPWGTTRDS
jgi:hypothetical protein